MEGWSSIFSATCSDFPIPKSGTWLEYLWAWVRVSFTNPCLRHYFQSCVSLTLCLALFASMTYSYLRVTSTPLRVVKTGNQYKASVILSLASAIGWSAMSGWRFYLGYQSNWSSVQFDGFFYASAEALTWSAFAAMLYFERWQALSAHTYLLRACWTVNFVVFSVYEGYSITKKCIAKGAILPEITASFLLAFFTCLVSFHLFVRSISGMTQVSVSTEHLTEPLLGSYMHSAANGEIEEEVTRYWKAGIFSKITFAWMDPLLSLGNKRIIQFTDVPSLAPDDSAEVVYKRLVSIWDLQRGDAKSLAWALLASFWPLFTVTGLLAAVKLSVMYAGPLLIQEFIDFSSNPSGTWQRGVTLVLALLLAKSIEVCADHQNSFLSEKLGLRVRAALIASVYRKGLRLSSAARQKHGVGKIVNHMAVDVLEISEAFHRAHNLWVLPLQIVLALVILYSVVGLATLTGSATMIAIMFICMFISQKQKSYQFNIMACKDSRIKVTNEAISNMKIIKLQAWQERFLQKVLDARVTERTWITRAMFIAAFSIFMLWLSPLAVSVITFGSCLLLNIKLTPGRVFTAVATFRILQDPLRAFPQTMLQAAQALVALTRLLAFFQGEEMKLDTVVRLPRGDDFAVSIKDGSFKWDSDTETLTLTNINLEVESGKLVAIVGMVGSGKSGLLGCILGELERVTGEVRVSGQVAYVSQSAWIQNGTIQDNILFGKPMNEALYMYTLRVCTLQSDLAQLPHGDQTEIGERGINLSGGQKQRIQLARAVYQEADIYMLDDIFSAVDAHTGTELFKECVKGALAGKTVLLVTHQVEFLHSADLILVLRGGEIVQSGRYEELVELGLDFGALVDAHNQSLEIAGTQAGGFENGGRAFDKPSLSTSLDGCTLGLSPPATSPMAIQSQGLANGFQLPNPLEHQMSEKDLLRQSSQNKPLEHQLSKNDLLRQTSQSFSTVLNESTLENTDQAALIDDEERATGQVTAKIYWAYFTKVFRGGHVVALLLIQTSWQGLQIASDFWLARSTSSQIIFEPRRFITVYAELAIGSGLFVLIRSLLVSLSGLLTAQKFFVDMITSIFRAPMSFFDTTPTGRVLSRSSKDQATVDINIPFGYGSSLAMIFQLMGALYVTIHITWQIIFIIFPLMMVYIKFQRYNIATSRELTRLESISDAPIIHHFSETMFGLATIRAFGHQDRFSKMNIDRLNKNLSINFHKWGANEWLGFRLESIGTAILCSSAMLLIVLPSTFIRPELVGLSLSYGMALNSCLFFTTWALNDIEQYMVAVERIQQYTGIPSEEPLVLKNKRPAKGWPIRGGISVQCLRLRYRPDTALVLKGLTFTLRGGEKLGIVGRTGSGKTSFIQALFRLVEPAGGRILVDGVDITEIGLNDLRSRLSIIPQEPTLFAGNVRSNIDPLEEHQDAEIWEALEKCQLADIIKQKDEKLDAPVAETGENWSMGQRQLFCLGRALLKKSRILVLDEATASVDTQTDAVLQRTIKNEFTDCTVVSIAHRIPSIMDSDKVLVLDAGNMKEFGAPTVLLENPSSLFTLLVQEYWNRTNSSHDITALSRSGQN